jgi:uncharacterized protein YjbJ (UPF0337 family)
MRSLPAGPQARYRLDSTGAGPFRQRNENEENVMDKDRIAGSAKEVIGGIKEATGKVIGDAKLKADGKAEKVEGKIQNAIGGIKDALKKQ